MKALSLFLLAASCGIVRLCGASNDNYDNGMPFGPVGDADVERLSLYAKSFGVDLVGDMERAYKNDDAGLSRVFEFSLKFSKLDANAKAYGQIIYSSLLNLGEAKGGIDRLGRVVAAEPKAVQQRVRDFMYFVVANAPESTRKEAARQARTDFPKLFPPGYVFGAGDVLFGPAGREGKP